MLKCLKRMTSRSRDFGQGLFVFRQPRCKSGSVTESRTNPREKNIFFCLVLCLYVASLRIQNPDDMCWMMKWYHGNICLYSRKINKHSWDVRLKGKKCWWPLLYLLLLNLIVNHVLKSTTCFVCWMFIYWLFMAAIKLIRYMQEPWTFIRSFPNNVSHRNRTLFINKFD